MIMYLGLKIGVCHLSSRSLSLLIYYNRVINVYLRKMLWGSSEIKHMKQPLRAGQVALFLKIIVQG